MDEQALDKLSEPLPPLLHPLHDVLRAVGVMRPVICQTDLWHTTAELDGM